MFYLAIRMLSGDKVKYAGLLLGIAFTAFLVTFAVSYFAGFMTRGFSLISENPAVDVWVMDPAVSATEQTINMPDSALDRVRSITGVRYAAPMSIGSIDARFPNGHFQTFEVIGIDDATLMGAPEMLSGEASTLLRAPNAVIVDAGGTKGKLQTPVHKQDQWPADGPHLDVPTRPLRPGDELLANDQRIKVAGLSSTLPRYPPRPLIYTLYSRASQLQPPERTHLTFVLVAAEDGVSPTALARRISMETGLKARTSDEFKNDTVRWTLVNSEDVGDMMAMLILAMVVGFGMTGVMLYMFTYENQKQYALLHALGGTRGMLLGMIFVQSALCGVLGTGVGLGVCSLVGRVVALADYPFRMMWFAPAVGIIGVLVVSLTAALISMRPVLTMQPAEVFAGR